MGCKCLTQTRNKQQEYLTQLALRHYQALLNFFQKRNRNIWDSQDLAQEVFCKILKRLDLPEHEFPDYYIYTIAWSVLRDRIRREQVRCSDAHISSEDIPLLDLGVSPEQHLLIRERFTRFMAELNLLPERVRRIFLLNRYKGYTYAQIAEHYGVSVSTIEKQMMKALARLDRVIP